MGWRKKRGPHWLKSALVNGLGGFVTGITVVVVLVAKFTEGAWITVIFIPLVIVFFRRVRLHYHSVAVATWTAEPVQLSDKPAPIVVLPIDRWSCVSKQALEFALRISSEIIAVHVEPGEHADLLHESWRRHVEEPFREAGHVAPRFVELPSPYRFVIVPLVQYVLELSEKEPNRRIVVVIPELVELHWYEYFLHNQRGRLLEWMLLVHGNERIFTLSSPYYLPAQKPVGRSKRIAPPKTQKIKR